ncbi:copper resistance system multicopper oxidase [Acidicapsa acidisoli]|uniref:copper resistance system multicopper oxidase n=1 Tax=Acidicapsa acidisoli TaxID=1615681 RepID=UPI0021DFB052|nr:copper resistance system multicopper oxidase [Acidicapsa acidisoli]
MSRNTLKSRTRTRPLSRRRFLQTIASAGAITALDWQGLPAFANTPQARPGMIEGNHFELAIESVPVNITGHQRISTAINGSTPGPTLRWREGDTITASVTNRLKVPTSIHWHGMRIPTGMDGVPGLSFPGIAPGQTFVYSFPVLQNGTYWYHSHSGFQEQTGLIGAIIIDRKEKDPIEFDREYVILLSDWSDSNPQTIYSNLKQDSDYYNYHRPSLASFLSEAKQKGFGSTLSERLMWARMNMSPGDIADVTGATYTFLINGQAPNTNWTGLFQSGERIRLRFINGSSMTFFDIRIPGLPMTVVQSDGNDVEPVTVDEFRIGLAETYDVIVQPKEDSAYTIFAQTEDRSGYARGTLATREGMIAPVPAMDPRPTRTMMDMGMDMSKMARMSGMSGMKMAGMDMSSMPGMKKDSKADMQGMDMSSMQGMKMDGHDMPDKKMQNNAGLGMMPGMKMGSRDGKTPFPQPGPSTMPIIPDAATSATNMNSANSTPVKMHPGPKVAMVATSTSGQLSNPGAGLDNNGRRVLTYSDLRARYRGVDQRPPNREIELHLTGNMERFIWGFNGQTYPNADPINLKLGERVRIILINDTMMEHPIHLHGLWSELENGHGEFNPYKHTIIVKPAERVSYLVSADTPGEWAYHCHLLFHMTSGMFRKVVVS